MDEDEQNRYVAQLKEEFDSCDTTGTGFLDKEELTALCNKLHLEAHLSLLLDTLLGPHHYARVNFQEFKDGFVAVLSRSLDFSTSDEESSYLEPVVPEEVKPKFVKGAKRYGRRSRPDRPDAELMVDSEDSLPFETEQKESPPAGFRRTKLRRATSLESVESLKSDEEPGVHKEPIQQSFEAQGQQKRWKRDSSDSLLLSPQLQAKVMDGRMKEVWEELEVGGSGFLDRHELSTVCDHLGLHRLNSEELDALFRKLDTDLDGRVSLRDLQKGFLREGAVPDPTSSSTPIRPNTQRTLLQAFEEHTVRSTSPSLLSPTVGQRLLSRLDDGTGCTSPERVIALWTEEGIRNSRDILQTLDFPLEDRVSLAELTLALDNELLVSGNGIHQATLISYKNEIQHLQMVADQACKERDKVKADLEWADRRNLQLVSEVDDRQATMESLNETKIKGIEQEFRDRLTALRSQSEQESEVLLQQVERDRAKLREEVDLLRAQEASLQEEASNAIQESRRLEEETTLLKLKLSEAESTVSRLQKDLDQLLLDKFGSLDPNSVGLLNQEEHFSQIVKDYELQCRELRDRNDELNSELEMLKSQGLGKRARRARDHRLTVSWSSQQSLTSESDSDDPEMRRSTSPLTRKKLQVLDKNGLGSLESMSGPIVSIETELAMQQLKEKHSQEVQDLKIDLETKVNFYERSLELMRQNMEVERKDISQSFKVEICELEEQKALAEEKARKVRESLDKLQSQLQGSGGGPGWGPEQERRARREQAELDQNYTREISNLVQRLTSEKDQLEAQLKLKMDQEVLLVREEAERQLLQMKQQHGEAQRSLVHQFHCEHQRQKDQHVAVETRLTQLEQERQREKIRNAEKSGEEQARIYGQFSKEKLRMEEAHRQEVLKHQEHIANLEGQLELALNPDESRLENGNFEAKLVHCKKQCEQLEVELKESNVQCKQLKDKFQVVCAQLKESITYLESHEVLNKRLISDKNVLEEELALAKEREQQLLSQRTPLQQELDGLEGQVTSQRQGKEMAENNCSRMSALSDQLQAQLLAKEQVVEALREALERSQEVVNAKVEYSCKQLAELESLRMDRAKLIEDLKEQAMAVDSLQLNIDGVSEELERLKMAEKKVREALALEQSKVRKTQSDLDLEREETYCLSREKAQYVRMADQLSSQITEMETETDMFRDQIYNLRSQLHENTVLVSDLRTQLQTKATEMDCLQTEIKEKTCSSQKAEALNEKYLNEIKNTANQLDAKDKEICTLKEQADNHFNQLQQVILESQVQLQKVVESTEWEKSRAAEQLMEMEKLVIALETVMDPASPHRSKLDAVNVENSALKDRLVALQQDIQCLEEDIIKKKQKLDEVEREHGKGREEVERIHKENSRYREEVLELSARNLELSGENAELNSRLRADQGAAQRLTEHLAQVSQEQEEGAAMIRRLQETTNQHDVERLRLQAGWQHDKGLLERELSTSRKKLQRLSEVESELKSLTLKQQWLEQDKERLLQEAEERTQKIENLQESTGSLDSQVKVLRYQLQASSQENTGHAQEVVNQQGMLQEAQDKVEELKVSVDRLNREKELLGLAQKQHEEKATGALQEECQDLRQQNQDLLHKLSQLQSQGDENERLFQECLGLRSKHTEFETAAMEAQDQALRANTALTLTQAKHTRGLQQLRDQAGTVSREQLVHLQAQLAEEQLKGQQLEESLSKLVQQTNTQMSLQQEQYEKVIEDMQEKMEEIELKLKSVRMMLQEKVKQLKEQLAKNVKSDLLLKDLYVENSQLMKALQVTEQRQKSAEKTNFLLEDKITALNKLLRKIAPASLTA